MTDFALLFRIPSWSMGLVLLAHGVLGLPTASAAEQKYWELSPYRVQLHLAVDDSQRPEPARGDQLISDLKRLIRTTLYPLWTTEISLAIGLERQRLLTQFSQLEGQYDVEKLVIGCDKQIFVTLVATPLGITLKSRELDCTTRRWGAIHTRPIRQSWMVSAQCFDLVCQTFSPLATIRPLPVANKENVDPQRTGKQNEKEILLRFRGSDLPQQTDLSFFAVPGEAYQPILLRTSSSGEIKADSIRDIPWTYLTLSEQKENRWHGAVHTATRRPFGIRRRGRIEHLALAIRRPRGKTRVRFYARHDRTQGLAGYEVFRREPDATQSQPMGLTAADGSIELLPNASQVTLVFLRSEGQLLAKVPIVPGAQRLVEVPIARRHRPPACSGCPDIAHRAADRYGCAAEHSHCSSSRPSQKRKD